MKITADLAQPILHKLLSFIDSNINIVDENGVIVASGDASRINQEHKGALQVLSLKKELIISDMDSEYLYGTLPEINLPIEYQDRIIGVIVIDVIGDITFTCKLAKVIKMNFEVFLTQMNINNQLHYKQKAIEAWIADLINPYEFNKNKLETSSNYIGLNNQIERSVILIGIEELSTSPEQIDDPDYFQKMSDLRKKIETNIHFIIDPLSVSSFIKKKSYFLLVPFSGKNNEKEKMLAYSIKGALDKIGLLSYIGIGERYRGVEGYRESYFQAYQSITLLKKMNLNNGIAHIHDWGIIRLMDCIPIDIRNKFIEFYMHGNVLNDELEQTLEVFIDCNLNAKEASKRLHLHRNTLIYRLDKISETLHLDPKKFNDAMILKLLLDFKKLNGCRTISTGRL
jgi:carbohydrate diacid regulator